MRSSLVLIFFLALFSLNVVAGDLSKQQVESHFKSTIESINKTLQLRQSDFKNNPLKLVSYVDEQLIPLWESRKTMRGLLGSKNWNTLSANDKDKLESSFNDTLQRYVQEGFDSYDGQQVEFVRIKFHPKSSRGLLTIKVIPNLLPSFNVDLKVSKSDQGWTIYDVLVKGVSYVSLKKEGVRDLFIEGGVSALITEFASKNAGYLASNSLSRNSFNSM